MNFLLTAITAIFLPACTVTITDTSSPKGKAAKHGSSHSYSSHKKPKPSPTAPQDNVKESWWIENYQKLEAAKGDYTIPDDAKIEPLPDGRFRVPDTVLSHYQDLLLAKPTPDH